MSRYTRGLPIAGTIAIMALAAGLAPADDWTLKFEDTFEREEFGEDWWASGLARIQDGELVIGREDDQGRNLVFCQREFEGAIRLEYDAMAPVDEACDLSAIINGTEGGYATGYFFGFGSQNNTVGRFLLKGQPGMEYVATITPHTWHHVVCERFGHRFRHIIDGETVLDYTHEDPLPGPMNRKVGFYVWHKGHFDNVRVFTRPEEVNVVAAVAQSLPSDELQVSSRVYPAAGKIGLSVDVPPLEGIEQVRLKAVLNSAETDVAVGGVERLTVPNIREELIFDARDWAVGSYVALVGLRDAHGELLGDVATVIVRWPGRDRRFEDVKALNNLVWELLNATADEGDLTGMHEFSVPIQRWLYIRTTAEVGDGAVSIILDSDDPADAVTVHDGSQRVMVAKRRVEAGEHFVQVSAEGDARLTQLEVRAIPDVQHSRYPTTVYHIEANPEYDWEFISRHILPSATTIITSGDPSGIEDRVRQWIDQGGRWIVYTSRPGLHGHREIEETGQRLFEHYSTKPGFAHPLMDGVLVDEFYTPNDPAYP
ncbi:MAG: hypothetical protein ACP5KN_17575, partial [Armatimonadota bacterium]